MPHKLIVVLIIIGIGAGYAFFDMTRAPTQIVSTDIKAPSTSGASIQQDIVPNPAFYELDGTPHTLHDFKGQVIILNFWATWCAPCIEEFPALLALAEQRPDTVLLVALSVDERKESIKPFLGRHALDVAHDNVIIGHDPGKVISQDLFQTSIYPETFIIGPDLRTRKKVTGVADWAGPDMLSFIDDLL